MAKSKVRRSVFVPRALVRGVALASVVPACAVLACGSNPSTASSSADAGADAVLVGVAAVAYVAYDSGAFSVAQVGYQGYETGAPEAKSDATADVTSDARDGASNAVDQSDAFSGFAVAYPAYEVGPPDAKSDAHDGSADVIEEPFFYTVADAGYRGPLDGGRG
ncbi:MAG TPA: hypothetical protein VN894_01725 [Polyangiaceae bacterium]|nr:hypothetical protein [Polyangiaceae bacterium]